MRDPKNFRMMSSNIREDGRRLNDRSEMSRFSKTAGDLGELIFTTFTFTMVAVNVIPKIKSFGKKDSNRRDNRRPTRY